MAHFPSALKAVLPRFSMNRICSGTHLRSHPEKHRFLTSSGRHRKFTAMTRSQLPPLRFLNKQQTLQSCPISNAIHALEQFHRTTAPNDPSIHSPPRIVIPTPHGPSLFMPASTAEHLACKIVHVRAGNAQRNLPTVPGMVLYYDQENGMLRAMLEGSILTCIRTSALSALATKYLSREDSRVLTVFGAGNEAEWHVRAMKAVREGIDRVNIINRTIKNAHLLAERLREEFPKVQFVVVEDEESRVKAVQEADIICTCTNTSQPVLHGKDISPGTHLNCIGAYTPTMQEIDEEAVARAQFVFCDASEAIWHEAGDLIAARRAGKMQEDQLLGDMFTIVNKSAEILDKNDSKAVRLFKGVGGSLFDTIVAGAAFLNAQENDIGQSIEM